MHTPPVTSRQPLWTRGKDSPNPFGRFAHFSSNPQSLRDSP